MPDLMAALEASIASREAPGRDDEAQARRLGDGAKKRRAGQEEALAAKK